MSIFKIKITGKMNPTDINWFIRFQLDPVKAQADYFKSFPQLKPTEDIVKNIEDEALKAFNLNNILKSLNFHKEIWALYQYMDPDIQKKFVEYTHDNEQIQNISHSLKKLDMNNPDEIKKVIDKKWSIFTPNIEQDFTTGLYLFNQLSEQDQLEIAHNVKDGLIKIILSFHPNKKVQEYMIDDICHNGTSDYNDVIAVYKKLGLVSPETETIHDAFVSKLLNGDIHQGGYKPITLADMKKHENNIRGLVHKDSPIINTIQDFYSAYVLKLFFEKNPQEAKALLPKFISLSDINDIFVLGDTLLLEPEAQFLREQICAKIFKKPSYFNVNSIHPNQIPTYAKFFVKFAVQCPDEWDQLCAKIADNECLTYHEKKRQKTIEDIYNGPEHYKYSREQLWEQALPFDGNFVKVLLLVHLGYGIPLNKALEPLARCLDMKSLTKLMSFKNMEAYQSQWQTLQSLYGNNESKSVEYANEIILSILGNNMDIQSSEMAIIC